MSVNKNPGSRDDNRGTHRGPNPTLRDAAGVNPGPSRDRDSDENRTGGTAAAARQDSKSELAGRPDPDATLKGHPNRVAGKLGKGRGDR